MYDIVYKNKIIEFNGDFWHANPRQYRSDDIIKHPRSEKKVSDVWELDAIKHTCAKINGYDIFVVWEDEFKSNRTETIEQCISFLTA